MPIYFNFLFRFSSIRAFFHNEVEKKCIENRICSRNYEFLDTNFFKILLQVTKTSQNAQWIIIASKNFPCFLYKKVPMNFPSVLFI